ncbi:MAG: family 14 glycosylhydrolase [Chthonomonadales bacterium]
MKRFVFAISYCAVRRLPVVWCVFAVGISAAGCAYGAQRHAADASGAFATLRVVSGGTEGFNLRSLSGADGFTLQTQRGGADCLTNQPGTHPESLYLYFALDRRPPVSRPVYVEVVYWDEAPGVRLTLEYDSTAGPSLFDRYRRADAQAGGWFLGSKRWRTALFELQKPRLAHGQNLGADFRLSGPALYVRSVRMFLGRPKAWAALSKPPVFDLKPLVHIGPGGQLILGGMDPSSRRDAAAQADAFMSVAPALKQLGVTSHEVYVRWNLCEPEPGRFDWSIYDRYVAIYRKYDLKWVPLLVLGPAYTLPDWYYHKPGSQGYVCLEHGKESDVQSLWNPELRKHVSRFIRAFCDHYRSSGVIEALLLGITGNYGEAIYPASGNDWTADVHGPYHTHPGFWAGDPYAVKSFRMWLIRKYGGPGPFRDAWGERCGDLASVKPFLRRDAPNERAWLDLCDWYIGSMTQWAHFWLQEARKAFPKGDIYLCTGGHAPPEHGSNFAEQCRVAAQVGAGVRITNEASDYALNFSLTRWIASAGKQYGAYFSFEPASRVDAHGVVARIYNATASGARGLHFYYGNLFDHAEEGLRNFIRFGSQFKQRTPIVEVAVYYPQTHIKLFGNDFLRYVQPLRDRFDFGYMADEQIRDGGLAHVKALILLEGNTSEDWVWRRIAAWVRRGGLLIVPDGMGPLRTVEGDESFQNEILGPAAQHGRGRVLVFHGDGGSADYRAFVTRELARAPELSNKTRAMISSDGLEDHVYVTLCSPNELLWLNYSPAEVRKSGVLLPPYSIVSQTLSGAP